MDTAMEMQIQAMREARDSMLRTIDTMRSEPRRPWRGDELWTDVRAEAQKALRALEQSIIDLEHELEDKENMAERYAEISAAIAFSGSHDDPSVYLHTQTEEEQWQREIRRQINEGYYDDEGHWNEGLYDNDYFGSCEACHGEFCHDELNYVNGVLCCDTCACDLTPILMLMAIVSGYGVESAGRWGDDVQLVTPYAADGAA